MGCRDWERGSSLVEVLLAGLVLSMVATTLINGALGAVRMTRRAGQMPAAAALARAVTEELRLRPFADPQYAADGTPRNWCPPGCPPGVAEVAVQVDMPPGFPPGLKRVTVRVYRPGESAPAARMVSYVRER